jgi:hypothetical protein
MRQPSARPSVGPELVAGRRPDDQYVWVRARRVTRPMMLVAAVIVASCSSSRSATQLAPSTSSSRNPRATFCDLYRRDAGDGQLRNWNLNDNAKTASYTATLRALADSAPPELKPDIAHILSYYAAPQPHLSPAEYLADLRSGERVLAYVQDDCGIDTTASPPPGDTSTTGP